MLNNIDSKILIMKKFIVETYYTCTFKTVHTLDELNEVELGHLEDIESELTPMLTELPDQLQEYLDDEM